MLKRMDQKDRWNDQFFRSLSPAHKLAWLYALDHCDQKGQLQIDEDLATFQIGMPIDWDQFVSGCSGRVEMDIFGVMWVKDVATIKAASVDGGGLTIQGGPKYPEPFERFWKAYPSVRKVKKGDTAKAWAKAVKVADAETIIEAAREYAESPLGSGDFSAMPSTWLNSRMWEDDRAAWYRDQRRKSFAQQRDENTDAAGDRFVQKWSQMESLEGLR